jgi:VanZ family protein
VARPSSQPAAVRFCRYVLPLIAWMAFIFGMSTRIGSSQSTSGMFEAVVNGLGLALSSPEKKLTFYLCRKAGHVIEYTILSVLAVRAVQQDRATWQWRAVGTAVLLAILYAASDEWHQQFVPSRTSDWHDVLIDTAGVALGIGLTWLRYRGKTSSGLGARSSEQSQEHAVRLDG